MVLFDIPAGSLVPTVSCVAPLLFMGIYSVLASTYHLIFYSVLLEVGNSILLYHFYTSMSFLLAKIDISKRY